MGDIMEDANLDFSVSTLGECRIPSPMVSNHYSWLWSSVLACTGQSREML
jgi:hypothetical protein